jgi:integrase
MPRKQTRNAQGAGTIRQRTDGRWEARYTVGRDPGTGKQVQKSIYGKTQKEVRQKLQQIAVAIDEGVYSEPSKLTVKDWLQIWLKEYTGNVKPYTAYTYAIDVNTYIVPALGCVRLAELTAPMVQSFYNILQAGSKQQNALSPKSIKNVHGVLHKALNQAVSVGYIRFNPTSACTLPRIQRKEIKPMDENSIATFLKVIRGHQFETIYKVDLFTGMRQSEILGLQWDCIDFERGIILINKQLQKDKNRGGEYFLAPLKNDKSRTITPAPTVMELLKARRREQLADRVKAGSLWDDHGLGNLVFTNAFGKHLCHKVVYCHFKKLVAAAGIPEMRFHDLRHSYAVASLQSGDDVKTVQENLGHHTAAFTLDVYGHVTERMKKDSARRMEGFIQDLEKL